MTQFIYVTFSAILSLVEGTKMTSQNVGESDIMKLHATLIGFLHTRHQENMSV